MKGIVLVGMLLFSSVSWSQYEDVDSILNSVFSSMITENRMLRDSINRLQDALHIEQLRQQADTIYVKQQTDETIQIQRLQQELDNTNTWIDTRAQQPAMLMYLDNQLCYMDLDSWRVQRVSNKRMVVVRKRKAKSHNITRRFQIILLGRAITYFRETD